jgi:hypothetical protein
MNIEKTYAKIKAFHSNKSNEEIYAVFKQASKKKEKKKLEKRKSMMKSKQASETNDWRNCGINQGSD